MTSILQKIIEKKIISTNNQKKTITYNGKLPLFIKEILYKDNKERALILNKIKKLTKELGIKILDSFEEDNKIFIIFYENQQIIDDLFDSPYYEDINLEGCIEGHSIPIKKKEINNLFSKEISTCKIVNGNKKGTGFFCRININEIPFKLALFTNNHILNRDDLKVGKEIIFEHKNFEESKILEIKNNRVIFTDEELDYTCIEILSEDNIFKNNEIEKLFKIDQNILEGNTSSLNNNDIFILQYPNGNEFSFSIGKIDYIDNKIIKHTATTLDGSSGSPIIRRTNYSIIGIHFGSKIKMNNNEYVEFNLSTNIFSIINDIKIKLVPNKLEGEKIIKDQQGVALEKYKKIDNLGLIKYKSEHFILVNSIKPVFEEKDWKWKAECKRRFLKEFSNLKKESLYEGFQIYGIRNDKCIGVIEGPPQTPYEKGFFLFEIILSKEYPLGKNIFYFRTKIFHPNIGENGLLSIYFEGSFGIADFCDPSLSLAKFFLSCQSILDDPNPYDHLNEKAAKLYIEDRKKYEETAKEYTLKYATFLNLQNELNKYKFNIEHVQDIN